VNVAYAISQPQTGRSRYIVSIRSGECIRFAANAEELTHGLSRLLWANISKVNRCAFLTIDTEKQQFIVQRDYHPHLVSLVGSYPLESFGPLLIDAGRDGQTTKIADVANDQRTRVHVKSYQRFGIRAFVAAPLLREGELVSALAMASAEPREWSEREVSLINMVAERTWLAVEKLRRRGSAARAGFAGQTGARSFQLPSLMSCAISVFCATCESNKNRTHC
jgi:GAF domain-containing protein